MRIAIFLLLLNSAAIFGQSKSIRHFRSDHEENSNVFIYSSTMQVLNQDSNPEIKEILSEIDEIRILNYDKTRQMSVMDHIAGLKYDLQEEGYVPLLMMNEKGNGIELFGNERRGKTIGMVALIENEEDFVIIDLVGNIDINRFLELKQRFDNL